MLLHTLAFTASVALVANGLMLPSTMVVPDLRGDGGLRALEMANIRHLGAQGRLVKLACSGCSFAGTGSSSAPENSLILDFTTTDDHKNLFLNGVPFYTSGSHSNLRGPFSAPQAASSIPADTLRSSLEDVATPPRQLRWSSACTATEAADGTDARIIDIVLHIDGLDEEAVSVDNVSIRMLENSQAEGGAITFVDVITKPTRQKSLPTSNDVEDDFHILPFDTDASPAPTSEDTCQGPTAFLCKWRAVISAKIARMRSGNFRLGCGGNRKMGTDMSSPTTKGGISRFADLFAERPHGNGPHHRLGQHGHHGHHGHRLHRVFHAIHHLIVGFILPVLIGIAAGMTASLLGMIFGTLAGWLWVRIMRGGRGRCSRAAMEEESMIESDEKIAFLTDGETEVLAVEAPPVYAEKD